MSEALAGVTAMVTGEETVTAADADLVGSAWLVATTWKAPEVAGAVYVPSPPIDPPPISCTDQATTVSAVPETEAWNLSEAPLCSAAFDGVRAMPIGKETETAAEPDFVGSAWLVATTWYVPVAVGAVYVPSAAIDPPVGSCTDHATDVSMAPRTDTRNRCWAPGWTTAVDGETATRTPVETTVPGAQAAASARRSGRPICRECMNDLSVGLAVRARGSERAPASTGVSWTTERPQGRTVRTSGPNVTS